MNKQFGSQLLVSEEVIEAMDKRMAAKAATNFGCVALKGWHKPVTVYKLA